MIEEAVSHAMSVAPGGEPYFDALDARLREPGYFEALELHVREHHGYVMPVVVSGRFGESFAAWRHERNAPPPTVLPGGLRDNPAGYSVGAPLYRGQKVIFLDDSLYAGRTRDAVRAFVEGEGAVLACTHVLYDGSPERLPGVHALYRWHA